MMKKISWLFDITGITGAGLMLFGLYLSWGLATILVVSGLMIMGYALRLSYLYQHDTAD